MPEECQHEAPLLVIAGPTASGKTALALFLAEQLNGEIVSCDAVQVYRGLDIGSAKPTAAEQARVPHHGLDLYAPDEHPTAGDYARHARAALADIRTRGKLPIIAGGAGLYLRATIDGLAPAPPRDEKLRERLRKRAAAHGSAYLHRLLQRLDAQAARIVHPNDQPKVIRALEMTLTARRPQSEQWSAGRDALRGFRVFQLGLNPERAELYARINARCAAMFEHGLLDETECIRTQYGDGCRALTMLGYAQALAFLRGEVALEAAIAAAQQGHRNYAKRQMTWFRADRRIRWLEGCGDDDAVQHEALAQAREFVAAHD